MTRKRCSNATKTKIKRHSMTTKIRINTMKESQILKELQNDHKQIQNNRNVTQNNHEDKIITQSHNPHKETENQHKDMQNK